MKENARAPLRWDGRRRFYPLLAGFRLLPDGRRINNFGTPAEFYGPFPRARARRTSLCPVPWQRQRRKAISLASILELDWGLEPAASSWIQLRGVPPLNPPDEPPPRPREERQPNKPGNNASPEVATIMVRDLPRNVGCDQLRGLFEGIHGIVAVFYSSLRHTLLVDFLSLEDAQMARRSLQEILQAWGWISGFYWGGGGPRPLNPAFFCNDKFAFNRDTPSPLEKPESFDCTVCVEGFDSSIQAEEMRSMLARHFGSSNEGISIVSNLDGSSNGKAYIKCGSWSYFSEVLNLDGSDLAGHKLRVTLCHWGDRFWSGHINPNGPGTGKRILFNNDSDDE